jgi:hypothetical protein
VVIGLLILIVVIVAGIVVPRLGVRYRERRWESIVRANGGRFVDRFVTVHLVDDIEVRVDVAAWDATFTAERFTKLTAHAAARAALPERQTRQDAPLVVRSSSDMLADHLLEPSQVTSLAALPRGARLVWDEGGVSLLIPGVEWDSPVVARALRLVAAVAQRIAHGAPYR